jgi:RNA polymerase sigma-70 factor (sigma-E family)
MSAAATARAEFEQFVAGAAEDLLRTAYLVVWDAATAEDLVQECLFRVARRWPRVRRMDHPGAYARRVLVNLALRGSKRRARDRSELQWPGDALADRQDDVAQRALTSVESAAQLVDALGELSERQRTALVLRYFLDLSEPEVAKAMGCSVGTVKSTSSRALERVRQRARGGTGHFDGKEHTASERTTRI